MRDRTKEQVETHSATTVGIMSSEDFKRGFEDARKGILFDWRVGGADVNAACGYERGRQLAHIAPLEMPLRIRGRLNPKAIALCKAAIKRGLVI